MFCFGAAGDRADHLRRLLWRRQFFSACAKPGSRLVQGRTLLVGSVLQFFSVQNDQRGAFGDAIAHVRCQPRHARFDLRADDRLVVGRQRSHRLDVAPDFDQTHLKHIDRQRGGAVLGPTLCRTAATTDREDRGQSQPPA